MITYLQMFKKLLTFDKQQPGSSSAKGQENKESFAQLKGAYRISDMLLLGYQGKYYSQSLEKASATN